MGSWYLERKQPTRQADNEANQWIAGGPHEPNSRAVQAMRPATSRLARCKQCWRHMDRVLTLEACVSSVSWALFDERDVRIDASTEPFDDAARVIARRIGDVDCVVHRIAHGGARFDAPIAITARVRHALDDLIERDPLHMRPALATLDASRTRWAAARHVAAFDTAGGGGEAMPARHGLGVAYAVSRAHEIAPRRMWRILVLYLGAESSATAFVNSQAVDTTRAHPVRSIAKHASSMLPAMGGLDAMVFTGDRAEKDVELRAMVTASLGFTGIALDAQSNAEVERGDRVISASSSPCSGS